MRSIIIIMLLLIAGCVQPEKKTTSDNVVVLVSGLSLAKGDLIYHQGKWWRIKRISSNSEVSWGRFSHYVELEVEK